MEKNTSSINPLISVNYHLTRACNYACEFCYARFPTVHKHLSIDEAKRLIKLLHDNGTEKITFVGGEPFVYPHLGELVQYAKSLGMTTMIVTNGSLITQSFLEKYASYIDWIGLSIDSGIESIEQALGRKLKNNKSGDGGHVQRIRNLVPLLRKYGIRIKINTVVTKLNCQEDMNWLIEELAPERWKVFQVLQIIGENDRTVGPLLISHEEFQSFIQRHHKNNPSPEDNDAMTGSYIMINPEGQFFDNTEGHFTKSRPILEVGVIEAFNDISFSLEKLINRGGLYNWSQTDIVLVKD